MFTLDEQNPALLASYNIPAEFLLNPGQISEANP